MRDRPRRRQPYFVQIVRADAPLVQGSPVHIDDVARRVIVDLSHGTRRCLHGLCRAAELLAREGVRLPVGLWADVIAYREEFTHD